MNGRGFKVMSALQCNKHNSKGPSYFRVLAAVFILVGIFLFGCSMAGDAQDDPRTTKEGMTTAQTPKSTVSTAAMPPIDAVAYARIETATFALG
jgi:hypothetical protein